MESLQLQPGHVPVPSLAATEDSVVVEHAIVFMDTTGISVSNAGPQGFHSTILIILGSLALGWLLYSKRST